MEFQSIRFIQEIRYFTAAYEECNFTKAAKREHCTQSGLSTHIKHLETMLSQRLFDRHARGVTATVAGACLYACCTDLLGSVKIVRQRMLELSDSAGGTINIGVPFTFGRSVLAPVLRTYLSSHPFVEVHITEGLGDYVAGLVDSGNIEAAIVTEPAARFGLESTRFFGDRLVLVTGRRGKRKTRKSATASLSRGSATRRPTPERALKLVLLSRRHASRLAMERKIRLETLASGRILEIDGLEARLEFVRTSDWTTILPAFAVAKDVRAGRLWVKPLPGSSVWSEYFVVQKKGLPLSGATRDFLQLLKTELERISGS